MPYKDPKIWYTVRIPRTYRKDLENLIKERGATLNELMTEAVDSFIKANIHRA